MRRIVLLLLPLLLPACSTYSLQELRTAPPKGTPFQASLAAKYLRFSEELEAKYNWADSGRFADKGLQAAYGNDVAPEKLTDWNIPAAQQPILTMAHDSLMTALGSGAREAKPEATARAQVYFDCWVENQAQDWQPDEIAYCRDGFEEAMKELSTPLKPPEEVAENKVEPVEEKAEKDVQRQAYIVFFGLNRDGLDAAGQRVVDSISAELKTGTAAGQVVVVNGHADTKGSKRYNSELSKRRADAVVKALAARGVPRMSIRALGFGETDLKVPTGDSVAEPQNRRVEIFLGD